MRLRGNKCMRLLDRWGGIAIIRVLSFFHRRHPKPADVEDIGLMSLAAIGDMILSVCPAIPAIRARYPKARIHIFITQANRSILPLMQSCDSITVLPLMHPLQARRLMRQKHCDILIDFNPWPRISALLCALAGAKFTIGFQTGGQYRHYLFDAPVRHNNRQHELKNNADLLSSADINDIGLPDIRACADRVPLPELAASLRPYVIFHPWAAGLRHEMREWPAEKWQDLARRLAEKNFHVIITGGPADATASAEIIAGAHLPPGVLINGCGHFSLEQTAAVIRHSAAMVSVNTGPMHMAAAIGVPLIALNGPTNPDRWGPVSPHATNIQPQSGTYGYLNLGFEYPRNIAPCMQNIPVGRVWQALLPHLGRQDAETSGSRHPAIRVL